MVPDTRGAKSFQLLPEKRPHVDDPLSHGLDVGLPLGEELGVVQDAVDDTAAVSRRVGIPVGSWTKNFKLGIFSATKYVQPK